MRTNIVFSAVAVIAMLASSQFASATIVYANDFSVGFGQINNNNSALTLTAADANFASQYLTISSTATGGFTFPFYDGVDGVASSVSTFSFDGRFNTTDFADSSARIRLRARPIGFVSGNDDMTRVDLGNGGTDPTADSNNHYDFAINNTVAGATIEGLGGTLAPDSWAIYENGALHSSGGTHTTATSGATIDYLTLWVQGDNTSLQGIARIDNFEVRDNAFVQVIPEPASIALLGLGALVVGLHRRRRMK